MAVVALGGAAFLLVAAFAGVAMSCFLVDCDLCWLSFVAFGAVHLLAMAFVVEGDIPLLALVGHSVGSVGQGEGECNQHDGNNQFLHVFLLSD